MNCLCNLFNNDIVWVIIAILVILFLCNNCGGYNGCGNTRSGCGCGCS